MTLRFLISALAALAALGSAQAGAAPVNLIGNGDFDVSNVSTGDYAYGNGFHSTVSASDWSFTAGAGVANNASAWGGVASSNTVAFIQSYTGFGTPTLSQTFTSSASDYAISFSLAQRPGQNQSLNVLLDGTLIGATLTPGDASWATYTLNASGLSGASHTLSFQGVNNSGSGDSSLFLDHVSVAAAVPEPETYAMLLAGLGLLGFTARRRAAKAA